MSFLCYHGSVRSVDVRGDTKTGVATHGGTGML